MVALDYLFADEEYIISGDKGPLGMMDVLLYWAPLNVVIPTLNFCLNGLSLAVTILLFTRAAVEKRWLMRCWLLLLDAVVAVFIVFTTIGLATILLGLMMPRWLLGIMGEIIREVWFGSDQVANLENIDAFRERASDDGRAQIFGVLTYGPYVLVNGITTYLLTGQSINTIARIYLIAASLMSCAAIVPTLLHVGVVVVSIFAKPVLAAVDLLGRQIGQIFSSERHRAGEVFIAILSGAVFLGLFAGSVILCYIWLS